MAQSFVAVAGATGGLGRLLIAELTKRGASVKALVRPGTDESRLKSISGPGVTVAAVGLDDVPALTQELKGASIVVSTVQGLKDVMHTAQGNLLDAAVAAKVPRFIPSDFALDFTKTRPGSNRNLDLRREFHTRLEASGIAWTSILNGAFMDMLSSDMSPINDKKRTVIYAGSPTQPLDYTTMKDLAAYTAAVATDSRPLPKFLRIAGDVRNAEEVAAVASKVHGVTYKPSWIGSVGFLEFVIFVMKLFGGQDQVMPMWQGMQYLANMASGVGKLDPLDNSRYPDVEWTSIEALLRQIKESKA